MSQEKKLLALLDDAMAIIKQQQREAELQEQRHQIELSILRMRLQVRQFEMSHFYPLPFGIGF